MQGLQQLQVLMQEKFTIHLVGELIAMYKIVVMLEVVVHLVVTL
jgi:hypothetical protein